MARLRACRDVLRRLTAQESSHRVTLLLPGPEGHVEGETSLPKVGLTLPLLISGLPVAKGRNAAPRDQRMVTLLPPTIAKPL